MDGWENNTFSKKLEKAQHYKTIAKRESIAA